MKYILGLVTSLVVFWLLLSGHYTPLLLGFGAASVALVGWLAHRMDIIDHEGPVAAFSPRLLLYWAWLLGQILVSALAVSRLILFSPARLRPVMRRSANTEGDELNQVTYANSITLTPGTLSVAVHEDGIEVHSLDAAMIDELDAGDMRRRVRALQP